MKFLVFIVCLVLSVEGWKERHGNEFKTYSIGERLDRGDLLFLNETVESKIESHDWPREHRLEYKIQNHDDLLSFAQIDIVDSDEPHEVHINTQSNYYEILVVSTKKLRGFVKIYHKATENVHHFSKVFPSFFSHRHSH